ncbi:MAG: hypothetical protein JW864_16810 [Spirochaetes bacterium]|nr:hypothetical protein [Spirochaetota bacterium]
MNKITLIFFPLLLLSISCSSGNNAKTIPLKDRLLIAVTEFQNLTGDRQYNSLLDPFNGNFVFALQKTQCFRLIERKRLNALLREHKLKMSGLVDPEKSAEIGKLLGIDAVLVGNLAAVNYTSDKSKAGIAETVTEYIEIIINARIVSVQTGEILASGKSLSSFENTFRSIGKVTTGEKADLKLFVKQAMDKAADEIAQELANQVRNF